VLETNWYHLIPSGLCGTQNNVYVSKVLLNTDQLANVVVDLLVDK